MSSSKLCDGNVSCKRIARDVLIGALSVFAGITLRDFFFTSYELATGENETTPKEKKFVGRLIFAIVAVAATVAFIYYTAQ